MITTCMVKQVTTHSKLLSTQDVEQLHGVGGISKKNIVTLALQAFGTEQQFSRRLRYVDTADYMVVT